MADRLATSVAVPTVMLVLAMVTVALRCWVKKMILKVFFWDDWFMLLALAVFIALVIISYIGIANGTGHKHTADLPNATISLCLHLWTTGAVIYLVDSILIKASISIFLLRLAMERWQRYLIYATLFVYTTTSIGFIFNTILQCTPVAFAWDKSIPNGTCRSLEQFGQATNVNAALTTSTDLVYALLPIWMVRNIQMNIYVKISVFIILSMGLISTAATCVRFVYVNTLGNSADFIYDVYYIELWSTVEPGLGITAASAATLRPLLRIFTRGMPTSATIADNHGSPSSSAKSGNPFRGRGIPDASKKEVNSGGYFRGSNPDVELLEEMAPIECSVTGGEKADAVRFDSKALAASSESSAEP